MQLIQEVIVGKMNEEDSSKGTGLKTASPPKIIGSNKSETKQAPKSLPESIPVKRGSIDAKKSVFFEHKSQDNVYRITQDELLPVSIF